MQKCWNCGFWNQEESQYCRKCGNKLKKEERYRSGKGRFLVVSIVLLVLIGLFVWKLIKGKEEKEVLSQREEETLSEESSFQRIEEAETVPEGAPVFLEASVKASSYTEGYGIENIQDNDMETYWLVGTSVSRVIKEHGIGESFIYELPESTWVYGFAVVPGVHQYEHDFEESCFPSVLKVNGNGKEETVTLNLNDYHPSKEKDNFLYMSFLEPIYGRTFEITIEAVSFRANYYYDTSITELRLFTYGKGTDSYSEMEVEDRIGGYEFILEDSSEKYLSKEDISGLSEEECRIARNEIYARHGRRFENMYLQNYFDQFDWYTGFISPTQFTEDILNEYEIYNLKLLVTYEEEKGYR